jgi:hypothetical protein
MGLTRCRAFYAMFAVCFQRHGFARPAAIEMSSARDRPTSTDRGQETKSLAVSTGGRTISSANEISTIDSAGQILRKYCINLQKYFPS